MRKMILLAGLALVVGVFLPGRAGSATGGSDLPFKGAMAGSFTLDPGTGQSHVVGSGRLSHLGLTTLDEYAQFVPTGPDTYLQYYTQTLMAANGDQLLTTGVGNGTLTDASHATVLADYTASGGTGRFAAGSGSSTATIHVTFLSPVAGTWKATIEGERSYR